MKKGGNRLRSEAVNVSNTIIDTLAESNSSINEDIIEDVRNKIKTVLLFNSKPNIQLVINNNINIFNLIINIFRRSVKNDVFNILNYKGIAYSNLKYRDISDSIEIHDIVTKSDVVNVNNHSNNLLNKVILPIRDNVLKINWNIQTFIKKKLFTFDTKTYTWVFEKWLKRIQSIIYRLSNTQIELKDAPKYSKVVTQTESDIVRAAKDPFHRAIKYTYCLLESKKNYTNTLPKEYYNINSSDSLKRDLYKSENTAESLSNFMRNFLRYSWYLNYEQDLSDSQKIL